ncbi:hypothetical protein L2E82_16908 [Cichorium intybus]|uniref:Uncharacterized protein n=1 Tax=Cichorium intybus TaxID=13427 RepID=A0ACB9F7T7_CICIN|nr:hypothetical protein L2E82_16908 [Cichorium intybus]
MFPIKAVAPLPVQPSATPKTGAMDSIFEMNSICAQMFPIEAVIVFHNGIGFRIRFQKLQQKGFVWCFGLRFSIMRLFGSLLAAEAAVEAIDEGERGADDFFYPFRRLGRVY